MTPNKKKQKSSDFVLEQASIIIGYLNKKRKRAIRDIDLYIADAEKDAKILSRMGNGYYIGLKHGLQIAKEILQGIRNHG